MSDDSPAMDGTSGKHSRQEEKTLARKRGINRSDATRHGVEEARS